jgi:DNA repair photolyase
MPQRLDVSPDCGLEINGGESAANGDMIENALREKMNGKLVLYHECKSILTTSQPFAEKGLCTGYVLNFAESCCFSCPYCYVENEARRRIHKTLNGRKHQEVVVLRKCGGKDGLAMLESNLSELAREKTAVHEVVFTATHADPAANMTLVRMTAAGITRIFEETNWDARILSKSNLLPELVKLVPEEYHPRMILGVSTGTLDDKLAQSIEVGAALVSKRIESLRWLQDNGFRTFGMICPNLPLEGGQEAYEKASREMCDAIRVDRCEHVWAEPINVRGENLPATVKALRAAGYNAEADTVERIFADGNEAAWDDYAKATFTAHSKIIEPDKLRFLHYPTKDSLVWWQGQVGKGAILLGAIAEHPKEAKNGVAPVGANGQGKLFNALKQIAVPCTELGEQKIPECQPVVDEWFMEGDYGIIHGDRGVGKTFQVLCLAVAISGGGKCGPWQANGAQKVLYVDGEMTHGEINARLKGLGASENLLVAHHEALFHHAEATFNLELPEQQIDLARYVHEEGVEVLILDNLSVLFPGLSANNDNDDWEPIKQWLLGFRRRKVSVILVGHNGANKELRGGTRKQDDASWVIRLDRPNSMKGDGARFVSSFTKNRHAQRDPADVSWVFTTGENGKTTVSAITAPEAEFRRLVEAGETSATKIASQMGGGVVKGTVAKLAAKGVETGWMKIVGKGSRAKYVPV